LYALPDFRRSIASYGRRTDAIWQRYLIILEMISVLMLVLLSTRAAILFFVAGGSC